MDALLTIGGSPGPERTTIADRVFEELYQAIFTLELKPGTKLSEGEVARRLGVSRQPVREAFIRLARIDFLRIQPQKATEVCKISEQAVLNARFVREALEVAIFRKACQDAPADLIPELEELLVRQKAAVDLKDKELFHDLDDLFHRRIAEGTGCGFAWTLINEKKAQMDRVRYLSLSFGAQVAWEEHCDIVEALRQRDAPRAEAALRHHLSKIEGIMARIREDHAQYFQESSPAP